MMNADGDYIDDTSGKLLNNTLVEKARAEEFFCHLRAWCPGRW